MEKDIREIVYCFGDASVPPQYHRSYKITLTPGQARVVVDSYGDVLAEKAYEITREEFEGIVRSLSRHRIGRAELGEDEGCTGGTTETIRYSDAAHELFSGSVYHCGGRDSGNLGGDARGFADEVRRLIPDLGELLI
jgi:hypothetical protein